MPRNALMVMAAIVAVTGFVVYFNAIGNGTVNFDDPWQFEENDRVTAPVSIGSVTGILFTSYHGEYQPVKLLSYVADRVVWGALGVDVVGGMHLTNVLFHCMNAVLVAFLSVLVVSDLAGRPLDAGGAFFVGTLSGIYFAVHPVHVESVAWLSSRKDVLAFFFMLVSFLSLRAMMSTRKTGLGVTSIVCLVLALCSKATVVMMPLAALAYWFLVGRRGGAKVLGVLAVQCAAALACVVLGSWAAAEGGYAAVPAGGSAAIQFLTGVKTFPFYMRILLFPVGLSAIYPVVPATGWADPAVWWGAFMIFAQAAVILLVRVRTVKFIVLWYLLSLVPVLQLVATVTVPAFAADRYAYAASVSFAIAPAVILLRVRLALLKRRAVGLATLLVAAGVFYAGVMGVATWSRNRVWKSSDTLWRDVLAKHPDVSIAQVNLAEVRVKEGRHREARELYRRVIRRNPGFLIAHTNLGASYEATGDYPQAKAAYGKALSQPSTISGAYALRERARASVGLARLFFREERYLKARAYAQQALKTDSNVPGAASLYVQSDSRIKSLRKVADDLIKLGDEALEADPAKSERFYRHAAEAAVEYRAPREKLADLYSRQGRWEEALGEFDAAALLGSGGADFDYRYGLSALKSGYYDLAAERLSRALAADPSMTSAKVKLALARAYLREPAQALLMLKEVLDEDPSNSEARENFESIKKFIETRAGGASDGGE